MLAGVVRTPFLCASMCTTKASESSLRGRQELDVTVHESHEVDEVSPIADDLELIDVVAPDEFHAGSFEPSAGLIEGTAQGEYLAADSLEDHLAVLEEPAAESHGSPR